MSAASRSVTWFGFYLYLVGLTLLFFPNVLLSLVQIPETQEVWIRVVGVLALCIGFYYHMCGSKNDLYFVKLTVPVRVFVCICFVIFVLLKLVSPMLIGFGVIDLIGAIWTWSALREFRNRVF